MLRAGMPTIILLTIMEKYVLMTFFQKFSLKI